MAHSNSEKIESDVLFGLTEAHLAFIPQSSMKIHRECLGVFEKMQKAAAVDGIEIRVASGFRSFERQLAIWNAKALGQRDCLDDSGNCLDLAKMSDLQAVQAIMRFSALPGASRHHWGTDLDIYDAALIGEDYVLQLVEAEYRPGGPFHKLNLWLSEHAGDYGFYRPYITDKGGVASEAWHISYRPLAQRYSSAFNLESLAHVLNGVEMALKETVLKNLQYLFERYIQIP